MDGENNGRHPIRMDDLGGTIIFGNTLICMVYLPIHEGMTFLW